MEHRHGHRREIDVAVTVRTRGGVVGQGRLRDASASGARLETELPLAIHSVIDVVLPFAEKGRAAKRPALQAEIVRQTGSGFGVAWTEFAPQQLPALYEQDSLKRSPQKTTRSNELPTSAARRRR
jgi:PilZ domain